MSEKRESAMRKRTRDDTRGLCDKSVYKEGYNNDNNNDNNISNTIIMQVCAKGRTREETQK